MIDVGKQPLPAGWRWVRLGEILSDARNGLYKPDEYYGSGTPILKMFNIGRLNGRWELNRVDRIRLSEREEADYHLGIGDILLNRVNSRELVGKCAVVDEMTANAVYESKNIRVRLRREIADAFFVAAWANGNDGRKQFEGRLKQIVGQATINRTDLEGLTLPLPSLSEQQRIAAILKEQMAAVDRARAAAEVRLHATRSLPVAYMNEIFGPVVGTWPTRRLGECCTLLPSKSISTDGDAEVKAITTACLTETGFDPAGIKAARMRATDVAECIVSKGEVLVARSNTPELVGRSALYDGEPPNVAASDLTIRILPRDSVTSGFLAAHLSFLYASGYWRERAGGASGSMKKITRGQLQEESIPVPEIDEQDRLVASLNERMSGVTRLRIAIELELAAINALPAALLRRAFSGAL